MLLLLLNLLLLEKSGNSFRVEFVYFQETKKTMKGRGHVRFELPKLDLPVNDLFISIYLPENFRYAEFDGDLKEIQRFSKTPLSHTSSSSGTYDYQPPQSQMMMSNVSYEDQYMGESYRVRKNVACVLPVQIDIPTQGKLFMFEQLLVSIESKLQLQVEYREQNIKGCCKRRRLGGCLIM